MLKSKKLGGLWPGLALMLAAALLLAACGGVGAEASQKRAAAEPAQAEIMVEPAKAKETMVEEAPVTETIVEEVSAAGVVEMAPAEEEVLAEPEAMAETEDMASTEMVETEPMPEETDLAEADDPLPEMAEEKVNQGQAVEPVETASAEEEMMPAEMAATKLGPTEEQLQLLQRLKVLGSPAELHNEVWLNSDPLKLADLRGQVAIVEFWTFG